MNRPTNTICPSVHLTVLVERWTRAHLIILACGSCFFSASPSDESPAGVGATDGPSQSSSSSSLASLIPSTVHAATVGTSRNFIGLLNEAFQRRKVTGRFEFEEVEKSGPSHKPVFTYSVSVLAVTSPFFFRLSVLPSHPFFFLPYF